MDTLITIKASLAQMAPSVVLIVGGSILMAASLVLKSGQGRDIYGQRNAMALLSLGLLVVAGVLGAWRSPVTELGSGLFRFDDAAIASERLALLGGFLLIMISWSTAPTNFLGEYYGCLVIMLGAIPVVGASNDLVSLFLGLELISIPTYILLGITKSDNTGAEATIKYFLLSAFASAFFLMGVSYLYGVSGSTNLQNVHHSLGIEGGKLTLLGLTFVMCGLAFRITAVPFHFYAPDVFEGASLTMAGTLSYLPKVAGFVALIRLLGPEMSESGLATIVPMLLVCSALTMIVGNFMRPLKTIFVGC